MDDVFLYKSRKFKLDEKIDKIIGALVPEALQTQKIQIHVNKMDRTYVL